MKDEIMEIIETINESEAQPIFREIEDLDITDKEADAKFQEAIANFKIVINPQKLKRLIQKSICGKWRKDESLIDIAYADEEALNKMEVVIAGKEKREDGSRMESNRCTEQKQHGSSRRQTKSKISHARHKHQKNVQQ